MFRVYFHNFHYYSQNEASTLEGAKKIARAAGFQSVIEDPNGKVVASYCPINGMKDYHPLSDVG